MPVKDPLYFHRQAYAQKLVNSLKDGITHAFTLFAPRRMGKTRFLLDDVAPLATEQGFYVFYYSFMDGDHAAEGFQAAMQNFAQSINAGAELKTFIGSLNKVGAFGVGIERQNPIEQPRMSDILGSLARHKKPCLLLLDEVQELARMSHTGDLIRALRTGLDIHQDQIKTLFTGSSTSGLKAMFQNNKAPFFHFAHALDFPPMGKEFTDFLASVYEARTSQTIDRLALFSLFERLNHTPMYLRAIIQDMILNPDLPLNEAAENRIAQLDTPEHEAGAWARLKPLDKAILRTIAATPDTSPYSQANRALYAEIIGVEQVSNSSVQGALNKMQRLDLVSKNALGAWQVNEPLLKTWILENT